MSVSSKNSIQYQQILSSRKKHISIRSLVEKKSKEQLIISELVIFDILDRIGIEVG